jgi:uncharacterized protein YjiS (DUF1127 family)
VSTFALARNPSRAVGGRGNAAASLGRRIWSAVRRRVQAGRDRRMLQNLPDYVLADIGLEKIEIRSAADGRRDVWVIPHRYY